MDTFYHQHFIVVQCQFLTTHHTLSCGEVVTGQLHLLAIEEFGQLLVEEWQVQGMQMLEVIFALLVEWCLFTIEEIVIEGDANGLDAVDSQLDTESLTGGGLSR